MAGRVSVPGLFALIGVAAAAGGFTEVDTPLVPRQTYTGEATVYSVGSGAYGSCGTQLDDSEFFVALSNTFMMSEYQSPYCGKSITLTNTGASYSGINGVGNTVTVTVADTCPGCSTDHLDLSEAAWNSLTDSSPQGVTHITWQFNS